MAINIEDKKECTACSACTHICPKQCIKMVVDTCGFQYPEVNNKLCIECGLCEVICPITQKFRPDNKIRQVYAGWSKNNRIRFESTSGGIVSEVAQMILREGGCVVGAIYGDNNYIQHAIAETDVQLDKLRQSKYAQSDLTDIFSNVKHRLKSQKVLFCGAPCQIAGLKSYLGKEHENLYTIDFICRGVNSPKAYNAWLRELEQKHKAKIKRVWFKYKEDGWKKSPKCTRIEYENGDTEVLKAENNAFMSGYLGPNLYIRPSCGDCKFKGANRFGDITVGDFWGIEPSYDNDQGTSLVLINSEKGEMLIELAKEHLILHERSLREIIKGNVCFEGSVKIHPKSEEFLQCLDENNFTKLVKRYGRQSLLVRIKKKVRSILR